MTIATGQRDAKTLLRERTALLARRREQPSAGESMINVLEFRLGQERYALETRHVREVQPLRNLSTLPTTPLFVAGIVNVRGRIVPVLDFKRFFGLAEIGLTDLHRLILICNGELEFGLLADISVGVRTIARSILQRPPATITGIGADYVLGVTADALVVLDIDAVLRDPRIIVDEEVEL